MAVATELGPRHLEKHRGAGVRVVAAGAVAVGHRLMNHRQPGAGSDVVAVGADLPFGHRQQHGARCPVRIVANRTVVFGGHMDDLLARRRWILMALDAERP